MSDQGWERWPPKSKPIRVSGGIRARSGRGAIGKSWWSKRFIEVMESIGGNRLTRGRSYARAGQVLELAVSPGEVTAAVQGSRRQPYRVTVGLARFPEPVWETVEHALAEQAIYSARLLAGEMPPDIEDVFAAAGAPLFPQRLSDVRMSCSCPDHAQVCKHLAATFYLLAEACDDDPFQILHWRGRDREALLSRLRSLRGGAADPGPGTPAAPAQVVGAKVALAEVIGPSLAESVDRAGRPPWTLNRTCYCANSRRRGRGWAARACSTRSARRTSASPARTGHQTARRRKTATAGSTTRGGDQTPNVTQVSAGDGHPRAHSGSGSSTTLQTISDSAVTRTGSGRLST
jgi:uncharacterized Zn finger protein